jgi:hypothetical protein
MVTALGRFKGVSCFLALLYRTIAFRGVSIVTKCRNYSAFGLKIANMPPALFEFHGFLKLGFQGLVRPLSITTA